MVVTIYFWVMLIMFFGLKMALIYIGINVLLVVLIVLSIVLSIVVNPVAILLFFISGATIMLFIIAYPFYLLAISSKKKYKAGMYSSIILIVGNLIINILLAIAVFI